MALEAFGERGGLCTQWDVHFDSIEELEGVEGLLKRVGISRRLLLFLNDDGAPHLLAEVCDPPLREAFLVGACVHKVVHQCSLGAARAPPATLHLLLPRSRGEVVLHDDASHREVDGHVADPRA